MKKLKEIVRLSLKLSLGIRSIARACNISASTASIYVDKLKELHKSYQEIEEMDEEQLAGLVCPKEERIPAKVPVDYTYLTKEMIKKGVTLQLLYEEYKRDNTDGYGRTQFYSSVSAIQQECRSRDAHYP